ncbi:MAG TPA: cytochrome c [Vicinamibacterales bacterium]|jgi:mono/diheme cytochrome c family protein|nr:cytochrome c [Vicinamibacterales bacterium]
MSAKLSVFFSVICGVMACQLVAAAMSQQPAAPSAAPAADSASKTQWDGVYSDEQATRGEALYTKSCASCHGAELGGGDKGPALKGDDFDAAWNDKKMGELSERIRTTMPSDNPASLTRAQNADVLAFMLKKLGAPAGQTPLPTNVDQLNTIKYVAKKPA